MEGDQNISMTSTVGRKRRLMSLCHVDRMCNMMSNIMRVLKSKGKWFVPFRMGWETTDESCK